MSTIWYKHEGLFLIAIIIILIIDIHIHSVYFIIFIICFRTKMTNLPAVKRDNIKYIQTSK